MPDEPILRAKAREVIRFGSLPSRRPDRTWGGPGIGAPCTVCGEPIRVDQLEFEIEFARDSDYPGLDERGERTRSSCRKPLVAWSTGIRARTTRRPSLCVYDPPCGSSGICATP
jgi:hypothetical protein